MTTNNDRNQDSEPSGDREGGGRDPLARLSRLNPTTVVIATVALFLAILLLPDIIGAALILVIVVGLAWLLTRTWPVLAPGARAMRLVVIGLLVVIAVLRVAG